MNAHDEWNLIMRMMVGDFNENHDPHNGQFTSGGGGSTPSVTKMGELDVNLLKKAFPGIRRGKVVITSERLQHIKESHPQDLELFDKYGKDVITDPDTILKDKKNENTALFIRRIPKTNLEAVIRLAVNKDPEKNENSILSFHSIRDKNVEKLKNKSEIIFTKK